MLDRLEESPESGSLLETFPGDATIRRVLLKRFPYVVVYEILPDEIHVLAVAHTHRRPNDWLARRESSE